MIAELAEVNAAAASHGRRLARYKDVIRSDGPSTGWCVAKDRVSSGVKAAKHFVCFAHNVVTLWLKYGASR